MEAVLKVLLEEFWDILAQSEANVPRNYQFPKAEKLIKIAVGMRRTGKTGLLFQKIRELIAGGFKKERSLYINFEDDRIFPLDYKQMGQMVDAWYSLYPDNHSHLWYLFLDEVQNVDQWALVLRRLSDTKNVQIYATGSSAKLLSKEIATSLRGRSISIEVFPFSYKEYLTAHKYPMPGKPFGKKSLDQQRHYLLNYFQEGGFPGVQGLAAHERIEILQNYVQTVILRDIIERHQVTNITLLRYLIQFMLKSAAAPFSVNKFFNDIKSQGYHVSRDTLYNYLSYVEDAYLVFLVPLFTESLRRAQTTTKKIYAIDPGLVQANTMSFSDNRGRFFENLLYLDLRRQGKKIFYYL
ncbi:MAG: ATP-binding protein, partial [Deltaproteobacteria bacterium]|nr:ATP-binding protein [Deltaproteobacteria bacterium]